jgi:hypothetical protein
MAKKKEESTLDIPKLEARQIDTSDFDNVAPISKKGNEDDQSYFAGKASASLDIPNS